MAKKYKIFRDDVDVTLNENHYIKNQIGKAFIGGDGWVYEISHATANYAISGGYTIQARFNEQHLFKVSHYLGCNRNNQEIWSTDRITYKNKKYFIQNTGVFFRLCGYNVSDPYIHITPEVLLDIDLSNAPIEKEAEPSDDGVFKVEAKA